jgi:hypothetical protein
VSPAATARTATITRVRNGAIGSLYQIAVAAALDAAALLVDRIDT